MADEKITLDELNALLATHAGDPDRLKPYFIEDPDTGAAFAPALKVNPARVKLPAGAEGAARSAAVLNGANFFARMERQARFHSLIASGTYKGPVIVSEGDSWFQYPLLLWDTIDVLMQRYAVFSLDAAGDLLENMARQAEYRAALKDTGAKILLLSGGGNDLVAGGNLEKHLKDFDPALRPPQYLLSSFDKLISNALSQYEKMFADVARRFPGVRIVTHGYDYPIPDNGRWLGKPMQARGIRDAGLQAAIAVEMMDRWNAQLAKLAARHGHVRYLDLRNLVTPARWHDELHPVNAGYKDVAKRFAAVIEEWSQPAARSAPAGDGARQAGNGGKGKAKARGAARAATGAQGGPVGLSLHIGLNRIDPAHYDWDGALDFCHDDARAMEGIARSAGYRDPLVLLDADARRDRVIAEVTKAAGALKAGDIFLMSYAGHGSRVPDVNRDETEERDGLDETWCLYDGQLIDDELYWLWTLFAEGVRIVLVSDSCHSGHILRAPGAGEPVAALAGKARAMPLSRAAAVYRRNRAFYDGLGRNVPVAAENAITRVMNHPIRASVIQLGACQSNQQAMESIGNGRFTAELLLAYDGLPAGVGYRSFLGRIQQAMPETQTPNYATTGHKDGVFEGQRPFTI
jgi:hypothetical protein